jgi:hypothetical protein
MWRDCPSVVWRVSMRKSLYCPNGWTWSSVQHQLGILDARSAPRWRSLDQARSDSAQKIFAICFRLGQNFWLVTVFQRNFLKDEFDGIFWFESLRHELAKPRCEAFVVRGTEAGEMIGTLVLPELARGQTIESGAGFGIIEQGGKRVVPLALRTRPALEAVTRRPNQLSRSSVLQAAKISAAIIH